MGGVRVAAVVVVAVENQVSVDGEAVSHQLPAAKSPRRS